MAERCLQNESMVNVLIRSVPDEIHAELQRRAEVSGQSLQQFVLSELARIVERPSTEELFARIERRRGGRVGLRTAVDDLAAERAGR